jgi:ABC-type cobalt transport system substrate-binding protein
MAGETKLGEAVIPIRAAMGDLDKDLDQAKGKVETASTGISGALSKIKWGAVGAGAAAATGFLSDLAREGMADVASMEAVRIAVENAGGSWDTAEGELSDFIDRMRDTAAIGDDEMKPVLASLTAVTGDYEKSMNLAALAADLARGKNMSLSTAGELVGKVAEGNTSILKRYGITLDENASAEEALAELQKRFAGQAEAYGATQQGQMEALQNRIGDFREEIGQTMGPAMGFVGMLPGLSAGFTAVGGAVGLLMPVLTGLRTVLMTSVIPSIAATVVAMGPVLIPIAAIGAAVALLAAAWSNDWGGIRTKTEEVIGNLSQAFQGFLDTAGPIWEGVSGAVKTAVNSIIGSINGLIGAWNALEFKIPGFSIELPSAEILGQKIGGGTLGWEGLTVSTPDLPTIPFLAAGGTAIAPGLAVVGDAGPELLHLPRGAQVMPLSPAYAGGGNTYNFDFRGAVISDRGSFEDLVMATLERAQRRGRRA